MGYRICFIFYSFFVYFLFLLYIFWPLKMIPLIAYNAILVDKRNRIPWAEKFWVWKGLKPTKVRDLEFKNLHSYRLDKLLIYILKKLKLSCFHFDTNAKWMIKDLLHLISETKFLILWDFVSLASQSHDQPDRWSYFLGPRSHTSSSWWV